MSLKKNYGIVNNCTGNCSSCHKRLLNNGCDLGDYIVNSNAYNITGPREQCGVFGVVAHEPKQLVAQLVYHGLMALQHRGQEAAGLSVVNGNQEINTYKNHGLVSQALNPEAISRYWGNVSVGHVRYGTAGSKSLRNAQPLHFKNTNTNFSLVFNGNIANYNHLKNDLVSTGRVFTTNSDTEVIANLIAAEYLDTNDWVESLKNITQYLDGSYSLLIMTPKSEIYTIRDPVGFKPLCYGTLNEKCEHDIIASESCALDAVGAKMTRDVNPGEIMKVGVKDPMHTVGSVKSPRKALCMFEFVYFARPDSIIDGISVAASRRRMGRNLAKACPVDSDNAVVVPVPDSGRSCSYGFAEESGIPYGEGLMKNRYVWRTFIMPGQAKRMNMVRQKLNPVKSVISGKDVIIIDDSIVRGTTTKFIVKMLKDAGAKKVHVRISCPEVREPCYMGVDFPTKNELIVGKEELVNPENYIERIREQIGADSLGYQTIDGLVDAIGVPKQDLCLACLNGEYPLKNDPRKSNLSDQFTTGRN